MLFVKLHYRYRPQIKLNKTSIKYVKTVKYLGLILTQLAWQPQITNLKKECLQRMNLLKMIGHQRGADQQFLKRKFVKRLTTTASYI